jgi:DNA-binding winged helix-turn-helix (wHTH) protein
MDRKSKLRSPSKQPISRAPDDLLVSGALQVDLADQRVTIDGEHIALPPKVYELLLLLLSQPQRVHTREALFEKLWPQSVLLDANLTTAVSQLRKALTDPLREHLRTLPRVGYSWDAEVLRLPRQREVAAASAETTDTLRQDPMPQPPPNSGTGWLRPRWSRVGAIAIVIALAMAILLALSRHPAKHERLAVLLDEVEIVEGEVPRAWMGRMIADSLRQYLQLSPKVRVLTTEDSVGVIASNRTLGAADGADFRLHVRLVPSSREPGRMEMRASLLSAEGPLRDWRIAVADNGVIPASRQLAQQVLVALTGDTARVQASAIAPAALRAYEAGMRADDMKRPDEARASYERAIELSPGFTAARMRLAKALNRLGHADLAAAQWQVAAEAEDLGPEAQGEAKARSLDLSGRLAEAAAIHEALALRFPDEPMHRISAIDALIRHGGDSLDRAERALAGYDRSRASVSTQVRLSMLDARMHKARGHGDAEFQAYRRVAELSEAAGISIFLADAQANLGMAHRRRGEIAQARAAFAKSAAAFRAVGSEAYAQAAELNALLLSTKPLNRDESRQRADVLTQFAVRAAAAGNSTFAGQALDAAAIDWLAADRPDDARQSAERAAELLLNAEPAIRVAPSLTLAWIEIREGDAQAALRRMRQLGPTRGSPQDADLRILRVQAWLALGQPLRAQAEIDEARRSWSTLGVPAMQTSKLDCAEAGVVSMRGRTRPGKPTLTSCGRDRVGSFELFRAQAELSALGGDVTAMRRAVRGWAEAIERLGESGVRDVARIDLAWFRLEHGDAVGAESLLRELDADDLAGLPPPAAARYWLSVAVLAARTMKRPAYREALARGDRALGDAPGILRREYALLRLAERGPADRAALVIQRREAETAGLGMLAARARRLEARWQDSADAWADAEWWSASTALR